MARATAINNTNLGGKNKIKTLVSNSVSANTPFFVEPSTLDEELVFVFTPSSATGGATLTVLHGTGYAGVKDVVLDVSTSGAKAFTINSARHLIERGENDGLIQMKSTVAGTISVIQPRQV